VASASAVGSPLAAASQPGSFPRPTAKTSAAASPLQLSPAQQAVVAQLAVTDRHVRAHEQAHLAAAGPYATGGPSYGYTVGPDGKLYATSGEVSLDVSPDPSGPEATIQKARVIEAAANAPADPSTQDRMVAAAAAGMEQAAEQALAAQKEQAHSAYNSPDPVDIGTLLSQMM